MLFFAAILLAFLIIAPGIAAAEDSTSGYTNVDVSTARQMIEEGEVFLLDVRTPAEFNTAHIEGAVLIPLKNVPAQDPVELPAEELLEARISEVPNDKKILVHCKTGGRSATACNLLINASYENVYNMEGGINAWMISGYSVDVGAIKAKALLESGDVFLLDVRNQNEFDAAHIDGATLIPVPKKDTTQLAASLDELPIDKKVLVYCLSGGRSDAARDFLAGKGYTVYNLEGGIPAWIEARYSVTSTFVDGSDIDYCTKQVLNAKINRVLCSLEKGDVIKAEKEIDKFICFVNMMEKADRLNSNQATYLIAEAELIRNMVPKNCILTARSQQSSHSPERTHFTR